MFVPMDLLTAEVPAVFAEMPPADLALLQQLGDVQLAGAMSTGAMFAAWRMTQGIYRIDPSLYPDLLATPPAHEVPTHLLTRLPEWCIYVETPGLTLPSRRRPLAPVPLAGVWCRVDRDAAGELLAVTADVDQPQNPMFLQTHHMALSGGSVADCVALTAERWAKANGAAADTLAQAASSSMWLEPVINLLLYICSTTDFQGTRRPANPVPVRTKRGWRLFPADRPTTWDVGVRMGAALRAAYQAAETAPAGVEGGSPRGHIRRAHWHGFRSGPRTRDDGTEIPTAQRRFDLRWLPPIAVNLPDVDQLPAVVRPVR